MKLSIVIPVYNELNTIKQILERVEKAPLPKGMKREIIIVDDFSKDGTRDLLKTFGKSKYKIIFHEKNQGKGGALRTGYKNCTGDIIVVQDADLEYDPDEYISLVRPIIEGKADVVYGSRFMNSGAHRAIRYWHMTGNRLLTWISNMFSGIYLTDMETCYKVFKREIIDMIDLKENRFGIEPEFTAKVAALTAQGIVIYEMPVTYDGRSFSEGKKIGLKDAFRAVWCIVKYNNTPQAKFMRFCFNGLIIMCSQTITLVALMEGLNPGTVLLKNIAYALSIEVSIIFGYFLHSAATWKYKTKSAGGLIVKLLQFNLYTGLVSLARMLLFNLFLFLGMNYILNMFIGIVFAVILDFIGYDKLVFVRKKKA